MFLRCIKIENFKGFQDVELRFDRPDAKNSIRQRTILLGENGVGKSSLLKAIALVTVGTEALTDLLENSEDYIRYGQEWARISATLVTAKGEERECRLEFHVGDERSDTLVRTKKALELLDAAISRSSRNYFLAAYGASRRLAPATVRTDPSSLSYRSPRARAVATLFDPNAALNPLEAWAMDLDYRDEEEGLATVRRVLSSFLRGVEFHSIDKQNRRLMFKTPDGIVPLRLLSEGFQNVATWIGDLLYQVTRTFEDYRAPLEARGLLLIDEVDLHLHPGWQRELLSFLSKRLPNFQIVATTHSPLTAQQAGEGELHMLLREEGQVRLRPFQGNPSSLLVHQLLTTEAFGMETEESLEVQKARQRVVELRDKERNEAEELELKELRGYLSEHPLASAASLTMRKEHGDLLQQINSELLERRG